MATRTVTYPECDRAGCRRRKGVEKYKLVLYEREIESVSELAEGELCPAHVEMVRRFINNLFKNTKEYPDGPET